MAATAAVYSRTAWHGFISYDDPGYVTRNTVVKDGLSGAGVVWAFSSTSMSNWHPITWVSHMLDVSLFGLEAGAHHLMSVAIHAGSAVLLAMLLIQLTGRPWRSLTVAALFALHPLHVESVAWVSERKDVLSGLLWHLTLLLYVAYVRKPGAARYVAAFLSLAVGLMAKPMLVTLPIVLLVLDGWPLARLGREPAASWAIQLGPLRNRIAEKIPLLVLSVLSAAVTLFSQDRGGSIADLHRASVGLRISNACVGYVSYLAKAFWPVDLAVLYPFPSSIPVWEVLGSAGMLLLISALALLLARRLPYLAVGWLWFLVTLLPVIGLVQVGAQSMADRYSYLPLTGLFIAVVWGASDAIESVFRNRLVPLVASIAVIAAAATLSWVQLGYWKDSLTLFRHTIEITRGNYLIMNNYGAALEEAGRPEEAALVLERAIAIEPAHAEAYYNLGRILHLTLQDLEAASALYTRAIQLKPDYLDAHINLGGALNRMGRFDQAVRVLERARDLAPAGRAELRFNLGVSYVSLGRIDAARREAAALRLIDPEMARQLDAFVSAKASSFSR